MAHHIASQIYDMVPGEVLNAAINLTKKLDSGELLTGTPTANERTTSDLVVSNEAINDSQIDVLKKPVSTGKAVLFSVDGTNIVPKQSYKIDVVVSTDSTPPQTFVITVRIKGSAV